MGKERRSLQDRIRERQQSGFVGRLREVIEYQENLGLSVDDARRRFLFNIHGDAGVGKTYLSRKLQQIATRSGALTASTDESAEDVTAVMTAIAEEFSRCGVRLVEFEKRATEYRQRRHELEADPQAPDGIASFVTKTAVTIGLAAARDLPVAGSLLAPVDAATAADQVDQARSYLARKFSDHAAVRLLLSPADELTPVFVAGLNRVAADRDIALFFDTYERTGPFLDYWLLSLYAGRYGDLPETLITTISGQEPLKSNLWGDYLPVISDVRLEPFSEEEANQFLASRHVTNEDTIREILTLSGRLPLWLATLADARHGESADISDPASDAVERFLKWEPDASRREIAVAAAAARVLNQDVLAALVPAAQARELFRWLRGFPFVSQRGESWIYHEVVRTAMLRFQHAVSPADWRTTHTTLAQANARWASAVTEGTEDTWANPGWIDYTREETYHLLCADPARNLPRALAQAVLAAEHSPIRARQWAVLVADAGRDANDGKLQEWGLRLHASLRGRDLSQFFSNLINEAGLDEASLAVALMDRGESHRLAGRYNDALADFNRAIELDPSDVWAIAGRGRTHEDMGCHVEALADLNQAVELDPVFLLAIASRGETLEAMGRHDEALADLNRAVQLDPGDAWAFTCRGRIYETLGCYTEALADYNRAIELEPASPDSWAARGDIYQQMDLYEQALTDYHRAVELNPADAFAVSSRGFIYQLMDRYEEALADSNRAVELDPGDAWVAAVRGYTYNLMGLYEQALVDLSRAIELDPGHALVICSRGDIYRFLGRYEAALADLDRAIELDPHLGLAFTSRGQTYEAMGRYETADADFNRADELRSLGRA
jgi:tetratricopeptide (TPR) repeat protein